MSRQFFWCISNVEQMWGWYPPLMLQVNRSGLGSAILTGSKKTVFLLDAFEEQGQEPLFSQSLSPQTRLLSLEQSKVSQGSSWALLALPVTVHTALSPSLCHLYLPTTQSGIQASY